MLCACMSMGCSLLQGNIDITTTSTSIRVEMDHAHCRTNQVFELEDDQTILISFINTSAKGHITLLDPKDQIIFSGNGSLTDCFTCKSTEEGEYELIVQAKGDTGTILLSFPKTVSQ